MLLRLDSFDSLLGMHGSRRRNDNSLQPLVLQHVVVVLVQLHAVRGQIGSAPFQLAVVWRARSDELGAGGALEEIQGMAFAHAAETGAADF